MPQIEVDSTAYDEVRRALAQAASTLRSAEPVSSAVPSLAFGPLLAFVPPALNAVGSVAEAAGRFAGDVAERTADGITTAVDGFQDVDHRASTELDGIGEALR